MTETLLSACARLGVQLRPEQAAQCRDFLTALLEKNKVMNLTAITDPEAAALLHFADSLALLRYADLENKRVIDVGCGAGFPGVPLKIGAPSIELTLLDSLQKRIVWLDETLRAMHIPAQCVSARAEEFGHREAFDIVVSRAVARLNVLAELCLPLLKTGGVFLAMKGAAAQEEQEEAQRALSLLGGKVERIERYPVGDATHCVVVIRKLRPTPPAYPRRYAKIKQSPL